jgi:hypothetical protein
MKKCIYRILQGALLSLIFFACKYEPVGEYDRNVNQNADPPSVKVVELNLNIDSIVVYYERSVRFKFDTQYHNVVGVRLLIDTTEIGRVSSGTGEFKIEKWRVAVGIHTLKLEVYTGSGTGSIADSIGQEGYLFSKSWKLIVKWWSGNEVSTYVADGLLHIKWPEYDAGRFEEYYIYKYYDYGSTEIKIGSSKNSEFIDSTYVGEYTDYIIKARDSEGNIIPLGSTGNMSSLPALSFSEDTLNNLTITWTKSRFYSAVDSYQVFLGYNSEQYRLVKSTHNPDDTIFNFKNDYFSELAYVKLRIVPKKVNLQYYPERYSSFSNYMTFYVTSNFPTFGVLDNISAINDHEFVYIWSLDRIFRYSLSGRKIVEAYSTGSETGYGPFYYLTASPSGNYITFRTDWNQKNIFFANSVGLNPPFGIDQDSLPGVAKFQDIPVSDIGTGLINIADTSFIIYDFRNSIILGKYYRQSKYPLYPGSLKLSSQGDYLAVIDDSIHLIKFTNGDFKPVMDFPKPYGKILIEFDAVNPEHIVFWNGSQFSVRKCSDFSMVYEFPLYEKLEDIDFRNDELLTWTPGYLHIRSLINGSLLNDLPTNYNPADGFKCYLFNKTIVHTGGIFFTLN